MMPTCLQCLNLVPRRKLCLLHQPSDESSQSGTNVHAKIAGFRDQVLETEVKVESEAFKRHVCLVHAVQERLLVVSQLDFTWMCLFKAVAVLTAAFWPLLQNILPLWQSSSTQEFLQHSTIGVLMNLS